MKNNRIIKSLLIGLFAVVLSTVGLYASDELRGIENRLLGSIIDSEEDSGCPLDTVLVTYGTHAVCMDKYEAAADSDCLYLDPKSELETEVNLANPKCLPVSEVGRIPWRYVSYTESAQLCARVGKRLPTNDEWYKVALGTVDVNACVLNADNPEPGGAGSCSTALGVVNMVGNVWEWMSETVEAGSYNGRELPPSGYVELVDESGVVLDTSNSRVSNFGNDYASTGKEGVLGMLRGGFYGSREDGGIFSQNLAVPLNLTAVGVGFRCVKDVW